MQQFFQEYHQTLSKQITKNLKNFNLLKQELKKTITKEIILIFLSSSSGKKLYIINTKKNNIPKLLLDFFI